MLKNLVSAAAIAIAVAGCGTPHLPDTTDPTQAYVCKISGAEQDHLQLELVTDCNDPYEIAEIGVAAQYVGYKVCFKSDVQDITSGDGGERGTIETQFALRRDLDGDTQVFAMTGNVVTSGAVSAAKLGWIVSSEGSAVILAKPAAPGAVVRKLRWVIDGWIERK